MFKLTPDWEQAPQPGARHRMRMETSCARAQAHALRLSARSMQNAAAALLKTPGHGPLRWNVMRAMYATGPPSPASLDKSPLIQHPRDDGDMS